MLNVFNIGIILLLIMFVINGFRRGVIRELASVIGIVLVFVISWIISRSLSNFLCCNLPFITSFGIFKNISAANILIYNLISFFIIFSILMYLYSYLFRISTFLQKIVNYTIVLWIPSKILGAVVSLIKGYIIITIALIALLVPIGQFKIFQDSSLAMFMINHTPIISNLSNKYITSANRVIDLSKNIADNKISKDAANSEIIEMLLKYNITSEKTINTLEKQNKIKR